MYSRFFIFVYFLSQSFSLSGFFSLLLSFICMHSRKKPQKVVGFVADWCLFGIQHMLHIFHWVAFFSPFFAFDQAKYCVIFGENITQQPAWSHVSKGLSICEKWPGVKKVYGFLFKNYLIDWIMWRVLWTFPVQHIIIMHLSCNIIAMLLLHFHTTIPETK